MIAKKDFIALINPFGLRFIGKGGCHGEKDPDAGEDKKDRGRIQLHTAPFCHGWIPCNVEPEGVASLPVSGDCL